MKSIVKKLMPARIHNCIKHFKECARIKVIDIQSLIGIFNYENKIVFIAGLPKSGTTFVENFFYNVKGYVPRNLSGTHAEVESHTLSAKPFEFFPKYAYSYVKTHIEPSKENIEVLKNNNIKKIVIMYRDPRDVAISRYFHLLKEPKNPSDENYMDYLSVSKENGISHSVKIILGEYIAWIDGWIDIANSNPNNYLLIRYEDILANKEAVFVKISEFYNLKLSNQEIVNIIEKTDSEMRKGFQIRTNVGSKSTFRSGKSGEWREYFSDEDIRLFKNIAADKLVKFGYENDANW